MVFDLRANRSTAVADSVWTPFAACDPAAGLNSACGRLVRFSIAGAGQVSAGDEGRREQQQWQFAGAANVSAGSHQIRFGGDYRRLSPRFADAADTFSVVAESPEDVISGRSVWTARSPAMEGRSDSYEISLFAQDTWRAGTGLTLTYGLRWEFSPAPATNTPVYFLDPFKGIVKPGRRDIWPPQYTNFAPRFGLAQRLGQEGRTVIRAGAGLYHVSSLSIATDLVNGGPLHVEQYGSGRAAPFSTLLAWGFLPVFLTPYVSHWSVSVERALGGRDSLSAAYAGAAGRQLLRREIGGEGNTETARVALATNRGASSYHALQLQYRRRMAKDLQALVSYAWSHSIDNSSSDALLHWAGNGASAAGDRASSDFDVRHTLTGAFSYELPGRARGWALDAMLRARGGFPIDVVQSETVMGLRFANVFRPDFAAGPLWVRDVGAPHGRRLNAEAFRTRPAFSQGTLGRNAIRGFGMSQLDLAVRRRFSWSERSGVEVRVEAFNALNQANLADPVRFLNSPLFGQSPSMLNLMLGTGSPGSGLSPIFQIGGPRSVQAALRLHF
jgi:hypothetical protein